MTWTVCYFFESVSFSIITPPSSHVYDICIVKKCALKCTPKQVQNLFICFYFIIMHSWFKLDVTELVFPYIHFMRCVIFKMDLCIACWDLRVDCITCVTGEYTHHQCLEGVIWFILLTSFKEFCVSYFFFLYFWMKEWNVNKNKEENIEKWITKTNIEWLYLDKGRFWVSFDTHHAPN